MNKDTENKLFSRLSKNNCPVCDKTFNKDEKTSLIKLNNAKVKIHEQHIKYGDIG